MHFLACFVRLAIVREVGRRGMNPGVKKIDPDARFRALEKLGRQQTDFGKFLVEIFVDDRRFVDYAVAVNQHRHFAVRVSLHQITRFIFEVDFDELVGNFLFGQDNPCPVGIGSGVARIEFHGGILLCVQ
jgi:hypothetical protein